MPPRKCELENDVFPCIRKLYTRNKRGGGGREKGLGRESTQLCLRLVFGISWAGNNHSAVMKEHWNVNKNRGRAENSTSLVI